MSKSASVKPLDKILKVKWSGFRKIEDIGCGLLERVMFVEGGGEEGGRVAEHFFVDREGMSGGADVYCDDGLEEGSERAKSCRSTRSLS